VDGRAEAGLRGPAPPAAAAALPNGEVNTTNAQSSKTRAARCQFEARYLAKTPSSASEDGNSFVLLCLSEIFSYPAVSIGQPASAAQGSSCQIGVMAAEMPLNLRRARRQSAQHTVATTETAISIPTPPMTPSGRKTASVKKKVRFSDPGPSSATAADEGDECMDILSTSTGLTPMIRRTTVRTTPKVRRTPRRKSTPFARPVSTADAGPSSPLDGEVTFLPLRQVLDGRVVRRLRRNGLSEEMNCIHSAKRESIRKSNAVLEGLRRQLEERDAEIERLMDETVVFDTERVWALETEVRRLKVLLGDKTGRTEESNARDESRHDWTMAARDPYAGDSMAVDDMVTDHFGEDSMAQIVCGTPSRRANESFHSIPTPPDTSPAAMIESPSAHNITRLLFTPSSNASVQVALPDPEKQRIEEELESLRLEVAKLAQVLEGYEDTAGRLAEQMDAVCPMDENDVPADTLPVEAQVTKLLRMLSDRTAALDSLGSDLGKLGFAGTDAPEILTSLTTSFRAARLELEYLTPGEIALPLTSAGAATLDLLLATLRSLASQAKEADAQIDEYHALELSLRQQLGTRVEVNGELAREVERLKSCVTEREGRITDLEVGAERLKGAVRGYVRDMKELEGLVVRMEREMGSKNIKLEEERARNRDLALELEAEGAEKSKAVAELEAKLVAAVSGTEALQKSVVELEAKHAQQLSTLKMKHKTSIADLNKSSGRALALRDARVAELRGEIDRINASLRSAHETVLKLKVEKKGLEGQVVEERRRAKEAVDAVKAELEKVVRMSEGLLPATPKRSRVDAIRLHGARDRDSGFAGEEEHDDSVDLVGNSPAASTAESLSKKGKKRRRYDSGLGFLDEETVNAA
jgi:hypothetical protein